MREPPSVRARAARPGEPAREAVAAGIRAAGAGVDPAGRADRQHQRGVLAPVQAAVRSRTTTCWCRSRAIRCSSLLTRLEAVHGAAVPARLSRPLVDRSRRASSARSRRARARCSSSVPTIRPDRCCGATIASGSPALLRRTRPRDHRRRSVCGLSAAAAAGRRVVRRRRARADVRARRAVEVGGPAAGQARLDGAWTVPTRS